MPRRLSRTLDTAKLADALYFHFVEFQQHRVSDPQSFESKLKNSTLLFSPGADQGVAPLPWLLARMAGAPWSETYYRDWIWPPENYRPALQACGLRMFKDGSPHFEEYRKAYYDSCAAFGFEPSLGNGDHQGTNREIWVLENVKFTLFPEEITSPEASELWEGAITHRVVNSFERNPLARKKCIDAHGAQCAACGMDFERQYGEIGRNFIHVHHVVPLSEVSCRYRIDPVKDLVPLCPNCHAMIHKMDNPADVQKLKERVAHPFKGQ